VGLEVVHGEQGLSRDERQRLRGGEPDEHAADEAGPGRGRDAVDLVEGDPRMAQRTGDEAVDHLHMGAGRDLGHHAAIGRVLRDLAQDLVREDFPAPVDAEFDDRGRGLVAGGFDAEDAHGRGNSRA
jgi:hypothetical protein